MHVPVPMSHGLPSNSVPVGGKVTAPVNAFVVNKLVINPLAELTSTAIQIL